MIQKILVLLFCSDIIIYRYNTSTIHVDVLFIYCISLSVIYYGYEQWKQVTQSKGHQDKMK